MIRFICVENPQRRVDDRKASGLCNLVNDIIVDVKCCRKRFLDCLLRGSKNKFAVPGRHPTEGGE